MIGLPIDFQLYEKLQPSIAEIARTHQSSSLMSPSRDFANQIRSYSGVSSPKSKTRTIGARNHSNHHLNAP
jgi:hypothetical protein